MKKVKDVAAELDVSESWMEKMIKLGLINVIWLGGVRRIPEEEIERIKREGIDIRQG